MNEINLIVFWYAIIFNAVFWIILIWRVVLMKKMSIKTMTISTKKKGRNILSAVGFFGILGVWSILFIILAIFPQNIFILKSFWTINSFPFLTIIGLILGTIFQLIMWAGVITMGKSWRIGIDDKNPDVLITDGIFQYSRNPIFFGLDGIMIAVFLIHPNLFFLIFAFLTIIPIHFQILREEKHLLLIYGKKYSDYMHNTPRYFLFL